MAENRPHYPTTELDSPRKFFSQLGSFWETFFVGADQVRALNDAAVFCANETNKKLSQAFDSLNRRTINVFDTSTITPIVLKEKDINTAATNISQFNNTTAKFNDGTLEFDNITATNEFAFPLPKKLVNVNQIIDSIIDPQHVWTKNADFTIDRQRNALIFAKNPFTSGALIDSRSGEALMYLWACAAEFDNQRIFEQFAYVTNLKLPSSENYKKLTNAILEGIVNGGASAKSLDDALTAICDVPLVKEKEETVEHVFRDSHGLCIVTDKSSYRFGDKNRALVSVGQTVFGGQALVDGLTISEFAPPNNFSRLSENRPLYQQTNNAYLSTQGFDYVETQGEEQIILNTEETCPYRQKDLQAIAVGPGLLSACFYGELVFENKDVPLKINTKHKTGYTYASFELNGHPADVKKFFDEIHRRGIERRRPCDKDCCGGPAPKPIKFTNLNDNGALTVTATSQQTVTGTATPGATIELFADHDKRDETDPVLVGSGVVDFCGTWSIKTDVSLPPGTHKFNAVQSFSPGLPTTLARVLDSRKYGEKEPTEEHLPTKINPMQFLITNVLRNNIFVARIRVAGLGQNHLGLYNIKHVRQLLPPQTALIVIFEFNPDDEKIDATENLTEAVGKFKGAEPVLEAVTTDKVNDLGARLFAISGTCQ